MKRILFLQAIILFCTTNLFSQVPWNGKNSVLITKSGNQTQRPLNSELCGNGIDDDGNGLKDCEDYGCYFNNLSGCNCTPINVVWMCTNTGKLYWVNHQEGIEHYVGQMQKAMSDITWAPDGKLYGVDFEENKIWTIDPSTAQIQFVRNIPGYNASNAMTSDADGNLYLASRSSLNFTDWHIIKINPSSGQLSIVADLTPTGSLSAGDLAYANGMLYLACTGDRIASINIASGTVLPLPVSGLIPGSHVYGIVVKADGTLYLGDNNKLYSLNPSNMQASLYYTCNTAGINIWGMANFNDYCLAPGCAARVAIDVQGNLPYCSRAGVRLNAIGTGIQGIANYSWTLPDGSAGNGSTITATETGKYKVRYSNINGTCSWEDSVVLQILEEPFVNLGENISLCTGSNIVLQPISASSNSNFTWQDGSSSSSFNADTAGIYWMEASNACGNFRDSITVSQIPLAKAELGPDKEICESQTLVLKNNFDELGYGYTWNNGSHQNSINIGNPGTYWLDVSNDCGTVRDSIVVIAKPGGCDCKLYMPNAFTPNSDGKNDLIKAISNCNVKGEISIYNRNGELVFISKDLNRGWDGTYKGAQQPSGVLVYFIKYQYGNEPVSILKGSFVLIR